MANSPQRLSGVTGEISGIAGLGWVLYQGSEVPAPNAIGFAPHCLFININSSGDGLYINSGDQDGAVFVPVGAVLTTYSEGVHEIDETITIRRQRNSMGVGVGPPFLAVSNSLPGGYLRGADKDGTVLRFATSVTDAFIETENYGLPIAGTFWNDNNTQGDTDLRASLAATIEKLTIDGRALLHPYPYAYNTTPPDLYGPDYVPLCDGIHVQGSHLIRDVHLFQIPGTAIHTKGGNGSQGGAYGIYDSVAPKIQNTSIFSAHYGMIIETGDSKVTDCTITQVVKDGIVVNSGGSGSKFNEIHVVGADRGMVCNSQIEATTIYIEAARIGTLLAAAAGGNPGAHGTTIQGLNIGPATCWGRAASVQANGCKIYNIRGTVRAEDGTYTDIAGAEVGSGCLNTEITGQLAIEVNDTDDTTSKGVIYEGDLGYVKLTGGWNGTTGATFVKVPSTITGNTFDIQGIGDGGTVLDFTDSDLDADNGLGNEFNVRWSGSATKVRYPGGGTVYNLAAGNRLWINGVLQS